MASQSETGHTKNIAAFKTMLTYLEGYGPSYQPVAEALKLTNLQQQLADAEASLTEAQKKLATFNNATDERMKLFAPLKPLGTRIYNALAVSGVSQNTMGTAKTINRKLQGQRAIKIKLPEDPSQPPADNASVSQQSYDNLVAHLSNYIEFLQTLPEYMPNETELQITALTTYRDQLIQSNNTVTQATANWSNARINRNQALYANQTGIVDTAASIKTYVKSLFGPTSPQYKQISGISLKEVTS